MTTDGNLKTTVMTAGQSQKEVVFNDDRLAFDKAITEFMTLSIHVAGTYSVNQTTELGRASMFSLDEALSTPVLAAFVVTFPSVNRGLIYVENDTAFTATLQISGQVSPPTLTAGEVAIFALNATEGMLKQTGSGSGAFDGGNINNPIGFPQDTVAGLPAATPAGAGLEWATDLGGAAGPLIANGTVWMRMMDGVAVVSSDANFTLTPLTSGSVIQHTGTLTADRTLTLSTTGAYDGESFVLVRTGGGNFAITHSTGNIYKNQWAKYRYDGAAWFLEERGNLGLKEVVGAWALSDETTNLTTGTAKVTDRARGGFVVTETRWSVGVAQTAGSILAFDANKNGTTIFSTNPTIDNSEKTSVSAATPAVINAGYFADDDEITFDIDTVGTALAKGLKVAFLGYRIT